MSVVLLNNKITEEDLNKAKEEYGGYIKLVVDVEREVLTAGGEWHADGEKELLGNGSVQENLWGGGIDLNSGQIDYISLINTRPGFNNSQEVTDIKIRERMLTIIRNIFNDYVK